MLLQAKIMFEKVSQSSMVVSQPSKYWQMSLVHSPIFPDQLSCSDTAGGRLLTSSSYCTLIQPMVETLYQPRLVQIQILSDDI